MLTIVQDTRDLFRLKFVLAEGSVTGEFNLRRQASVLNERSNGFRTSLVAAWE